MNRSEILFLYDIAWANPNGDPIDENKPRFDQETGTNIVTDVRLKRTIRDYLKEFKNKEIFIREITLADDTIQDAKRRAEDFLKDENGIKIKVDPKEKKAIILDNILKECIDIRLFGGTLPLDKDSITFTGPVQFAMGTSLHKVKIEYMKGTGAFASKEGTKQKTFREEFVLPYSLISFYGIVNENAAKHTKLTEEDVDLLMEGIWNGTKNLISRSKAGQMPRFLMKINYKESNYHLGSLNKLLKLNSELPDTAIRTMDDYSLNFERLTSLLEKNIDKIESIEYCMDDNLKIEPNFFENFKDKILLKKLEY